MSSQKTGRELLIEFKRTSRQQPFEEIVRRYGPMVFGICFDITHNRQDAEDAAQAVFLALALQCRKNAEIKYLGRWLQQVAKRTSLDIRRSRVRRDRRERRSGGPSEIRRDATCVDQASVLNRDELHLILREEISQLPARYRTPLILYYFGGLSQPEMAEQLGCNTGTLATRLFRARKMLGKNLLRRGITVGGAALTLAGAKTVRGAVSDAIFASTAHLATDLALGKPIGGAVSLQVMNLAQSISASVPIWGAMRISFVLAVLVSSAIASAPHAIRQRLPDWSLPTKLRLDSTRLFEQMLRGFIPKPQLSDASTSPASIAETIPNSSVYWPVKSRTTSELPPPSNREANWPAAGTPRARPPVARTKHIAPAIPNLPRRSAVSPSAPLAWAAPIAPHDAPRIRSTRRSDGGNAHITTDKPQSVRDVIVLSDPAQFAYVQLRPGEIRWCADRATGYDVYAASSGGLAIRADNRLQITLHDMPDDAKARVSVVSVFDKNAPPLPEGHRLLSMWKLDCDDAFSSADLLVHYDSQWVDLLHLPEEHLKLWVYHDQWIRLSDASFSRDLQADLLRARASGDFTYIAVSAPEPGGLFILGALAGGALLRRRRA